MSKPKFDPAAVGALLNRGAQETAQVKVLPKAAPPASPKATKPAKSNMNIRLTNEVLAALDQEQNRLRSQPGSTRAGTTIGAVIEGLLRKALSLPAAP